MQLPCWCSSTFVTGCIAQTNDQLWDKPGCETTMCPFSSAVQVWASTVGPGWLWRDLPRVRANAQALLMKQLWCFTPHKFVYWPHSASGRQMWNNKPKDTCFFLCHLVANIFTPNIFTPIFLPPLPNSRCAALNMVPWFWPGRWPICGHHTPQAGSELELNKLLFLSWTPLEFPLCWKSLLFQSTSKNISPLWEQ